MTLRGNVKCERGRGDNDFLAAVPKARVFRFKKRVPLAQPLKVYTRIIGRKMIEASTKRNHTLSETALFIIAFSNVNVCFAGSIPTWIVSPSTNPPDKIRFASGFSRRC